MYQPVWMTWAKSARVSKKSIALFSPAFFPGLLYCSLLLGLLSNRLMAQETIEVDLSEFAHSVWVTGGTLNTNQVGTVNLNLGTSADPVSDAMGLRLELVISSDAILPSNPLSVTVSGSWLLSGVEISQSLEVDGSTRTMYLTLERDLADGSANGHGFALSFPLVSAHNGVNASTMVTSEGGVVIIENVDMRSSRRIRNEPDTLPSTPIEAFHFYPNPCQDQIQVYLPSEEDAELRLTGMNGRTQSVKITMEGRMGSADISPMKRGVYWAEVIQAGQVVMRQRIQRMQNE